MFGTGKYNKNLLGTRIVTDGVATLQDGTLTGVDTLNVKSISADQVTGNTIVDMENQILLNVQNISINEANIQQNTVENAANELDIINLQNSVGELETEITETQTSVNDLQTTTNELQTSVTDLENTVSQNTAAIQANINAIHELETDVGGIAEHVQVYENEISCTVPKLQIPNQTPIHLANFMFTDVYENRTATITVPVTLFHRFENLSDTPAGNNQAFVDSILSVNVTVTADNIPLVENLDFTVSFSEPLPSVYSSDIFPYTPRFTFNEYRHDFGNVILKLNQCTNNVPYYAELTVNFSTESPPFPNYHESASDYFYYTNYDNENILPILNETEITGPNPVDKAEVALPNLRVWGTTFLDTVHASSFNNFVNTRFYTVDTKNNVAAGSNNRVMLENPFVFETLNTTGTLFITFFCIYRVNGNSSNGGATVELNIYDEDTNIFQGRAVSYESFELLRSSKLFPCSGFLTFTSATKTLRLEIIVDTSALVNQISFSNFASNYTPLNWFRVEEYI